MTLKELKEIIDIVTSRESIEELELEKAGVRLRIRRASNGVSASTLQTATVPVMATTAQIQPEVPRVVDEEIYHLKSPIVGTFYKAASPSSEAVVSVGDFVEKGTVVCIIEAMKLMNEIESDVAGEIVGILVENGQPVEYGERLFAIRPR